MVHPLSCSSMDDLLKFHLEIQMVIPKDSSEEADQVGQSNKKISQKPHPFSDCTLRRNRDKPQNRSITTFNHRWDPPLTPVMPCSTFQCTSESKTIDFEHFIVR
jgi:hypothetical protein